MKIHISLLLVFYYCLILSGTVISLPCVLREYTHGLVCVCNSTYCDTLDIEKDEKHEFILVSSSKGGLRFFVTKGEFGLNNDNQQIIVNDYNMPLGRTINVEPSVILMAKRSARFDLFGNSDKPIEIHVDRDKTYQKISGFGGAFTGAVSHNLEKVTGELRESIYNSYFSKKDGIAYNMIRLSIGGCDFDLAPWAYNESPENDIHLNNFTKLDPRDEKKIEQIKNIMEITNNNDIKLFGTAWSPPPWMKTNNKWTGRSSLKPEYYQTWADYHLKFLQLMADQNMPLWAISTGNEPLNGEYFFFFVHFMSLGWTPGSQGKWVGENLGPSLRNSNFKDVKLFGPDDQRYVLSRWFSQMEKSHKNSTSFLDGTAVHWYWDGIIPPTVLDHVHETFEDKLILNTESCVGDKPWETHGPELGSWERAEKYIKSYIEDLEHWVNGWIDWNLILDENGGPNYANNFVDAPIIINATSGEEFYKQPIFYGIGHFSRFLPEDSVRISATSSSSYIETVAFQRPGGSIALIIYNGQGKDVDITISDSKSGNIVVKIPQRSVHTLVYN